jgi:hypothetical protein
MGLRWQYREKLKVCEHRCDERLSCIKPCEDVQTGFRTSGADSQHERNCICKKEEVGGKGLGLRVYVRPKVVVGQTELTDRCDQQTASEQEPQWPGLCRFAVSAKQANRNPQKG